MSTRWCRVLRADERQSHLVELAEYGLFASRISILFCCQFFFSPPFVSFVCSICSTRVTYCAAFWRMFEVILWFFGFQCMQIVSIAFYFPKHNNRWLLFLTEKCLQNSLASGSWGLLFHSSYRTYPQLTIREARSISANMWILLKRISSRLLLLASCPTRQGVITRHNARMPIASLT